MITPILRGKDAIATWLIDVAGNVAISISDLALLRRIQSLIIPAFVSTEEAMEWGSRLNPEQRSTLLDIQRSLSNAARAETDFQRMVNLATQAQLMREAAEAAPSNYIRHWQADILTIDSDADRAFAAGEARRPAS